ncbi:hypothetical protein BH10PLA2_BH10PLA2_16870 [soil metagenome]
MSRWERAYRAVLGQTSDRLTAHRNSTEFRYEIDSPTSLVAEVGRLPTTREASVSVTTHRNSTEFRYQR